MNDMLSRRERKKQETYRRLLEAALRLFHHQGYDDTTVEQIAEAADVAKGTFFNYFETKEALLPALVAWYLCQLEEALLPERGAPASPVARIKLALRLVAENPLADLVLARKLFPAMMKQRPDAHPGLGLIRVLAEQVHQAQERGEIRADLDALGLSCLILAAFFQQVMLCHLDRRPTPLPELLDEAVDVLLEGIAGPQWRPAS